MNMLNLLTNALTQRLASASVQPQADNPQTHTFTLPETVQNALLEHLQTLAEGAGERAPAEKQAKRAVQDETEAQPLEALMAVLLMPERPAIAEKRGQAALPEQITLPVQIAQTVSSMQMQTPITPDTLPAQHATATPKQLAEQARLATENLPAVASLGVQPEAPRPERAGALRHAVNEKMVHEWPEPASLAAHTTFIQDDTRLVASRIQPEQVVSVDTRAAQWGEALVHMLKENIHFQLSQQQQISTIRLDPPSLGKLEIAIQLDAGKLTVHIGASQADVCRTLQQCGDALRVQLTQQNFMQVEVQVSPDGQSQSDSRRQREERQNATTIRSAIELDTDESGLQKSENLLIKV
ncbi:putative flagellar hook-length control protein [Pseudescherichia vulneris NBRC 102420]|uniref:Putative flagellar hook-length control protein n=1 Tax=Pseudescherichia vulneris NBRC 102420 TaxID=1115515 RepID=A0A090V1J8_PSEVU|nr:flagellar hook-length control protein FliK [Pseudescherichia vulneris]GAL58691.1 putative flagellar hook-length control protein [Pseudescherichia vulneris NBRC 102420]STQ58793.1 lateral flagellar hook length control protein (FliK-like) [Pseudescherichia vulneris]